MFFHGDIQGDKLPPKTLCLTYDDGPGATEGAGPGPHTRELAEFLHGRGIPATFFVIGRHAEAHRDLLRQMEGWGHLLGNHTYSHPGLVALAQDGGDVVGEIARTDALLGEHATGGVTFLRAPYGNWREQARPGGGADNPTSIVAEILQRSGRFGHYVGPIHWDIVAEDWVYWRRGRPAEECARGYLDRIDRLGRGIVLMHDSSEEPAIRERNRTMQATKLMVPVLEGRGYQFVRLDAVPQVLSATKVTRQVALSGSDGRFVSARPDGAVRVDGPAIGAREILGVVPLGGDQVALRASHGQYLSPRRCGGGRVVADAPAIGVQERLAVDDLGGGRVAFRTASGLYLTRGRGFGRGRLVNAAGRGAGPTFALHRLLGD